MLLEVEENKFETKFEFFCENGVQIMKQTCSEIKLKWRQCESSRADFFTSAHLRA